MRNLFIIHNVNEGRNELQKINISNFYIKDTSLAFAQSYHW